MISFRNNKIALYIMSGVLCALLFSCAPLKEIPEDGNVHRIENVPFFSQEEYQCGPASLAAVMNYWGVNVRPDEIGREIFSKSARGTLSTDMVWYPQSKGLKADQHRGGLKELESYIDSGYPVIVLVDYGFSIYQKNHFMVVKGYNLRSVIVDSGKDRDKFISEEDFLKTWEKTNFWTLIISPAHP